MGPSRARARGGDAGERIAEQLRDEIVSGAIQPGSRIRQEELAERFSASRIPVREALHVLESDGLVRIVPNSGAWVSTLTLEECEEIYQMRERLEPLLLRYSAPLLDAEDLDELALLAHRISAPSVSTEEFLRLDSEFHLGTYAKATTSQLGELTRRLWNITAPYRRAYVDSWDKESRRIANEEHHLLLAALRDDDVEDAERVLAGHIRRTRRQLAKHPELFHSNTRPNHRRNQR